jgi:hypothetical protein
LTLGQKSQRDGHQHRRQCTTGQALQGAQDHQAFVVRGQWAQHAQQSERANGAEGEAAQRNVTAHHGANAAAATEVAA